MSAGIQSTSVTIPLQLTTGATVQRCQNVLMSGKSRGSRSGSRCSESGSVSEERVERSVNDRFIIPLSSCWHPYGKVCRLLPKNPKPLNFFPRMYGGICELAAENGASGGCFRRPFHNIKNVNVLKEHKMISSAFSVFSNVEVSRRPSRAAASQPPRSWLTIAVSCQRHPWIPRRLLSRAAASPPPRTQIWLPTIAASGRRNI